jgi:type IV pilus assembly protein PilY1
VQFTDSSWHTVLVGGEGAGGNTIYALDVTNPDSITSEAALAGSVLWEFSDPNLGLTFSQPVIANTSAGWLVFFGNGYDSPAERPFLYAVNPRTGKPVVAPIDLCAAVANVCDPTLPNGLSNVTVINNAGLTSAANILYAGDLQGNMWRVDITNSNPSGWIVSVIFQARDPVAGNPQPITTTPAVTLNPLYPNVPGTLVVFGTGQFLGTPDLATTQVQTLYSVFDPPSQSLPPLGFSGIPIRKNLVGQVMSNGPSVTTSTGGTVATRLIDVVNPVTFPANRGWYVDFDLASGERIVADPKIANGGGVVVTSYQPNTSSCTAGGNAWLAVLNYATGGTFPLPELDINGDNNLNSNDTVAGINPVAIALGPVYASSATLLSSASNPSGIATHVLVSTSDVPPTKSVGIRGASKQRTAWWELLH